MKCVILWMESGDGTNFGVFRLIISKFDNENCWKNSLVDVEISFEKFIERERERGRVKENPEILSDFQREINHERITDAVLLKKEKRFVLSVRWISMETSNFIFKSKPEERGR